MGLKMIVAVVIMIIIIIMIKFNAVWTVEVAIIKPA